ncbi:MAG: hypothetical protein R8M38_01930 [Mariprofundaceae bacterium]
MSVVTISNIGDFESLLAPEEDNHYLLNRVHIVIINLDDASMSRIDLDHSAMVKKIRSHTGLNHVAVIFSERTGKCSATTDKGCVKS